jgi:hypothetical protein
MVLARFPNIQGSVSPAGGPWNYSLIDVGGDATFAISTEDAAADRLLQWVTERDPWLHGYFYFSWADAYVPLLSARHDGATPTPPSVPARPEPESSTPGPTYVNVTVNMTGAGYGPTIKSGGRFYGVNLLSELDAEGEYYIDDPTGTLYFFPPVDAGPPESWPGGTARIAANETAVSVTNVSNVVLQDLVVTGAVHTGIEGYGVESVVVENCTVVGHGRHGIDLSGVGSGVVGCDVHSVGGSGVRVVGGTAFTLSPGNMYATRNHVHKVGYWKRTYQPALFWGGVNNTYTDNLFEDGPAMCIWGGGNVADGVECTFDGNTVTRCVTETCDQGSFHTCGQSGQAFINRGNVMRNGVFSHIQPGHGVITPARGLKPICSPITVGFYMDDEVYVPRRLSS